MNFIVDENLPQQVATWLTNRGDCASHVAQLALLGRPDADVWLQAITQNAFIITRDADFVGLAQTSKQAGVIRLLIGNCSTPVLLSRLDGLWPEIELRLASQERIIEIG